MQSDRSLSQLQIVVKMIVNQDENLTSLLEMISHYAGVGKEGEDGRGQNGEDNKIAIED